MQHQSISILIKKSIPKPLNKSIKYILFFIFNLLYSLDPRYHTYEEMVFEVDSLLRLYPEITYLETIGFGSSLPILAIKISDNPQLNEDEPAVLFNGVHHGCEVIGAEISLDLFNRLVSNYSLNPEIRRFVDSLQIWIVPIVNPSGHRINTDGIDTLWRKNTRDNNGNGYFDPGSDGVDLNRNYPFLWELGGSPDPTSRYYRGPTELSEPETQAMVRLALRERFVFDICYHSDQDPQLGERVYYPWGWGGSYAPDFPYIKPIAESLAKRIIKDNGQESYTPVLGYALSGGYYRNWLYYALGTFSYTVEVSTGYYPPGYRVDSICERNWQGASFLLQRALGSSIRGKIYDFLTNEPLRARVRLLEADAPPETILHRYSDSVFGRFYRIVEPGSYHLEISCPGFSTSIIGPILVEDNRPTEITIYLSKGPWLFLSSLPREPNRKTVGAGGGLTIVDDSLIYAVKGNNTQEIFCYNIREDYWRFIDKIPYSPNSKKRFKKGGGLVYDGEKNIYLVKGGNSNEFWSYDWRAKTFSQLPSLPVKIKSGSGITINKNHLYLLRGGKTLDFFRCSLDSLVFEKIQNAPAGLNNKGYGPGSSLVSNKNDTLYLLKGNYNEFYLYDIGKDSWYTLPSLPFLSNGKKRRAREGAALAYSNDNNRLFAIKGRRGQELFVFNPESSTWQELNDTIPRGLSNKNLGPGSGIFASDNFVYLLKGNRTLEFLRYTFLPDSRLILELANSQAIKTREDGLTNPISVKKFSDILKNLNRRFSLIRLYSVTGRELKGNDLKISAGIYFLEIKTERKTNSLHKKLVIVP